MTDYRCLQGPLDGLTVSLEEIHAGEEVKLPIATGLVHYSNGLNLQFWQLVLEEKAEVFAVYVSSCVQDIPPASVKYKRVRALIWIRNEQPGQKAAIK